MAELKLVRPVQGTQTVVDATANARFTLDFPPADAAMHREGDNLVFSFDDDSHIVVRNFYTTYNQNTLPDFEQNGETVSGREFFASLGDEMQPDPAPATPDHEGHPIALENMAFAQGIDRLPGLDLGLQRPGEELHPQYPARHHPTGGETPAGATPAGAAPVGEIPGGEGPVSVSGVLLVEPPLVISPQADRAPLFDGPAPALLEREAGVRSGGNVPDPGTPLASGAFNVHDPDAGDVLKGQIIGADGKSVAVSLVADSTVSLAHGTLFIHPETHADGSVTVGYTYTLNQAEVTSLPQGATVHDDFRVVITDGAGQASTEEVGVTIVGTNERPLIETYTQQLAATERSEAPVTGSIVPQGEAGGVMDPDKGDTHSYTLVDNAWLAAHPDWVTGDSLGGTHDSLQGKYGTLTMHPDGTYSYQLDNTNPVVRALVAYNPDNPASFLNDEVFHVAVSDNHGGFDIKDVNVLVRGVAEPVIHLVTTPLDVTEAGVQNGGNVFDPGVPVSLTEHLTSPDAHFTGPVTFAITPQNLDGLTVLGAGVNAAGENWLRTEAGTLYLDPATGAYRFEIDNSSPTVQHLALGETLPLTFTASLTDAWGATATQGLVVNVHGTNDVPELTLSKAALSVTESGYGTPGISTDSGVSTGTDSDHGAALHYAATSTTTGLNPADYGTFAVDPATGAYSFVLDNTKPAVASLAEGDTVTLTYTVRVTDEHGAFTDQPVTVTLHGSNDAPTLNLPGLHLVEAGVSGGNIPVAGVNSALETAQATDPDRDDAAAPISAAHPLQLAFTGGTNGFAVTGTGVDSATGETFFNTNGGTLYVNLSTGAYHFTLDNSSAWVNALNPTQTAILTFAGWITDSHGAPSNTAALTVTVTGTDERPLITAWTQNLETSAGGAAPTGTVAQVVDPDSADTATYGLVSDNWLTAHPQWASTEGPAPAAALTTSIAGQYGTFVIDPATGAYHYELNPANAAVLALTPHSAPLTETFHVAVEDRFAATDIKDVQIVIRGPEVPVIHLVTSPLDVTEAGVQPGGNLFEPGVPVSLTEQLTSPDAHFTGPVTFAVTPHDLGGLTVLGAGVNGAGESWLHTEAGTLYLDPATGAYRFEIDNTNPTVQHLNHGDTLPLTFTASLTDAWGATASQNLVVNIHGTNDVPDLTLSKAALSVTESGYGTPGVATDSGTATGTDIDHGAVLHYAATSDTTGLNPADYGTFTVNPATGAYSFVLDNTKPAVASLAEGDTVTLNYTVRVTDEHGAFTDQPVTVTLHGANDAPTLNLPTLNLVETGVVSGNYPYPGVSSASQMAQASDPDRDDAAAPITAAHPLQLSFLSSTNGFTITGTGLDSPTGETFFTTNGGTLYVNLSTGAYHFTLDNSSPWVNALNPTQEATLSFAAWFTDSHGVPSNSTCLAVTITGTDERPLITAWTQSLEARQGGTDPTGAVTQVVDPDNNDGATFGLVSNNWYNSTPTWATTGGTEGAMVSSITGQYGTFVIDPATGAYHYVVNAANPAVMALTALSAPLTETFHIAVLDHFHGSDIKDVSVLIRGPEAPVIHLATTPLDVTEAGVQPGGNLFEPGVPVSATQHLTSADANFTGPVTFAAVAHDLHGLTVTGTGVNGDGESWLRTEAGTLFLNPATGAYRFEIDNASPTVQHLASGETLPLTFTASLADAGGSSASQDILVNIHGTNDVPTLALSKAVLNITERGYDAPYVTNTDSGTASGTDTDHGAGLQYAFTNTNTGINPADYGAFTVDPATGAYSFVLDNTKPSVNSMAEGDTVTLNYTVRVTDEHGAFTDQPVTVTLHGANDGPLLNVPTLSVKEAGIISGNNPYAGTSTSAHTVQASDPDHDDAASPLNAAHPLQLSLLSASNGFTITGTGLDSSTGETFFTTNGGTLYVNLSTGYYHFTLDNSSPWVNALNPTQMATLSFAAWFTDSHGAPSNATCLAVEITGTDERPLITAFTQNLDAYRDHAATGSVSQVVDPDNLDAFTYGFVKDGWYAGSPNWATTGGPAGGLVTSIVGKYGTITIDRITGEYHYDVNPANASVLALTPTSTPLSETFHVAVQDRFYGTDIKDVHVLVRGNSTPLITLTATPLDVTEAGVQPGSNVYEAGVPVSVTGTLAVVTADPGGVTSLTVTPHDLHGLTLTGSGVNGAGDHWYSTEAGTLFYNPASGQYHFEINNSTPTVNGLALGETLPLTFSVTATTASGFTSSQDILINVHGTNDAPVLALSKSALVLTERGYDAPYVPASDGGTLTTTEPDHGAVLTYTVVGNNPGLNPSDYGAFTVNPATGAYSFALDNSKPAVSSMIQGDTVTLNYTVRVTDEHGAMSEQPVSVTIHGANDAPTLDLPVLLVIAPGVQSGNYPNAGVTSASLMAQASDPDRDDAAAPISAAHPLQLSFLNATGGIAITGTGVDATTGETFFNTNGGTLYVNLNTGAYHFTLDTTSEWVQSLNPTQGATLSFSAQFTDSHGTPSNATCLAVTIYGTDERPLITSWTQNLAAVEDGPNATGAVGQVVDPDSGDGATYGVVSDAWYSTSPTWSTTGGAAGVLAASIKGAYGTFVIDPATGAYHYEVNNADPRVQALNGQSAPFTETFHVAVQDRFGGTDIKNVTVTIHGTDDMPVFQNAAAVYTLTENGVVFNTNADLAGNVTHVTGQVAATDVDNGGAPMVYALMDANGQPVTTVTSPWGTLHMTNAATGAYEFTLDSASDAVNQLKAGEMHEVQFAIGVQDSTTGQWVQQPVLLHIQGTNDRPVIVAPAAVHLTEDGGITVLAGSIQGSDPDYAAGQQADANLRYDLIDRNPAASAADGDKHVLTLEGHYGYMELDPASGQYTYHLYNDSAAVQQLKLGETGTDTFIVRVTDPLNAWSEQTVSVNVHGANELPTTTVVTPWVTEDTLTAAGSVTGHDVDGTIASYNGLAAGQSAALVGSNGFGTLVLHSDGSYTYTLNNPAALQSMNEGEVKSETFTVNVLDNDGGLTPVTLNVDIHGVNDVPIITPQTLETTLTRDSSAYNFTGTVQASDVDDTTAGGAFNGGFYFIQTDNLGHPVLDAAGHYQLVQGGQGTYGSLVVNPDGTFKYILDNFGEMVQSLGSGDQATDTFHVVAVDAHGGVSATPQVITVHIDGSGTSGASSGGVGTGGDPFLIHVDQPVMVNAQEEANIRVVGNLAFTDNTGTPLAALPGGYHVALDAESQKIVSSPYGSMCVDPLTGEYTFTLNNANPAVQTLAAGQVVNEQYAIYLNGAPAGTISVQITGTNDAPVIHSTQNLSFDVVLASTASGTAVASDVDQGDVLAYSFVAAGGTPTSGSTVHGQYGTMSVDASGHYTYTVDPAHLPTRDGATESFTLQVDDAHGGLATQVINVAVLGPNVPPVLTPEPLTLTEDGTLTAAGSLHASDDTGTATLHYALTAAASDPGISVNGPGTIATGHYGTLILASDGSYTYRLDNGSSAVQSLDAGQQVTENFAVSVSDKHGGVTTDTIVVHVGGTNDAPVLTVNTPVLTLHEGDQTAPAGQASGVDVDAHASLAYSFVDAGGNHVTTLHTDYGTFGIDASTGAYHFTPDNTAPAMQSLAEGEIAQVSTTIMVDDGLGGTATHSLALNITGANTAPVIGTVTLPDVGAALHEDGGIYTYSGSVPAVDPDHGAVLHYNLPGNVGSLSSDYGTLHLGTDGSYTYTLNNGAASVQALAAGETHQDTFSVTVTDEHGAASTTTLSLTITGSNDAPQITSGADQSMSLHDGQTASGVITATDIDHNSTLTFSAVADAVTPPQGSLQMDPSGLYTYTPGSTPGATDMFNVTVNDGHGGTASTTLSFTAAPLPAMSALFTDNSLGNMLDSALGGSTGTGTSGSTPPDSGTTPASSGTADSGTVDPTQVQQTLLQGGQV